MNLQYIYLKSIKLFCSRAIGLNTPRDRIFPSYNWVAAHLQYQLQDWNNSPLSTRKVYSVLSITCGVSFLGTSNFTSFSYLVIEFYMILYRLFKSHVFIHNLSDVLFLTCN